MPESDRTKIADVVRHVKRLVNSNTRTEQDVIKVAIADTSDDTTFILKRDTAGIRTGSYISVNNAAGTNLPETMYVYERNDVNVTVRRGVDGSYTRAWEADTSIIEVEPRFTEWQILESVRDAIQALPNNLYAVATTTADFSTTEQSVTSSDLATTGFSQVLSATRTARSGEDRLLAFNVKIQEYGGAYEVIRQEGIEKTVTVRLTYAHPFVSTTLDPDTDLVSTVGMTVEMLDIPALGAAASLLLGEESVRLDLHSQGNSRSDAAVVAGDRARYSLVLQAQYDRRVSQEARRLMAKYGIRTGAAASSVFPTTVR
tara:strand:+ start:1488 stop:2432 length:945 start_codon:yes stop_codon:yes gene_type:complete